MVEFDGHRLDIRLKVVTCDPLGFEQEFEIDRAWLLVIIDVCTRAVLGYYIALGREYSRYDVIKTIEGSGALRQCLPEFLVNSAKTNFFAKFIAERQDPDTFEMLRLAT
ncbi:hypothetical protein [Paraburkholderia sprentiae]|uniref:hypothetical protein n=1 Tax=Paraburkholderia sprentiae TaxID=948107 RepID=UPI000407C623|nr:hypothetical protein [Paraburkholderia sprentiae]